MQKEIPKRKPEYALSTKVIEERRSDVPLNPHRRKFPSFGSGKMANFNDRESSAVIRPPVFFSFILFAAVSGIRASKTGKRVRILDFPTKKCRECPRSAKKEEKRHRKKKRKPALYLLRIGLVYIA